MDKEKIKIVEEYMKKIYQIFGLFDKYEDVLLGLDEFFDRITDEKSPYYNQFKNTPLKELSELRGKRFKKIKKTIVAGRRPFKVIFVPEVYFYEKVPNGIMFWLFVFVKTGLFRKKLFGFDIFCVKDGLLSQKVA